MYSKHEITEAEHRAWFSRLKDDTQSRWYVHVDVTGQLNGVVYFTQLQLGAGSAFWGFYAADDAKRGVGVIMEFDALELAFSEFGLHKINCEVLISNDMVINMHKKFGFTQEGLFRDFHFNGEKYVDVVRLGILATEWAAKRDIIQGLVLRRSSIGHTRQVK
jgi:UDP-4-amino-4,6-dideoxy-N-acetyl-beta-L-altrosamine N-acetyltransferase